MKGFCIMRVAIIGTSGQLATELRRRPWSPGLEPCAPEKVDIADRTQLLALLDRLQPGLVLNASAYTAVDRAESERERAFAVNAGGVATLAEWCGRHEASLIHVSTDYVFDGRKSGPYTEDDATAPLGVYGASKLAGEEAVRGVLEQHVILRTSRVFSAHGNNFVKTMLRLARERDELRVVADQHGKPTAAADLADAMLRVAQRVQAGDATWGTFHFAGAGPTTWHGFAQAIVDEQARHTGRKPTVTPISTADFPTPTQRPGNSVLDTSRFEAAYALVPREWRVGLAEVVGELQQ
jgi:dTDP-4-dehydrorhamnose reductase